MKQKIYSLIGMVILFAIFLFPGGVFAEKMVVIDPGHGGKFTGTCGYTKESGKDLCERDVNLSVGLKLRDALKSSGIKVFMTRETDIGFASNSSDDLRARTNLANGFIKGNNDNSIFISVHHNASPTSPYVKGYETYYYDYHNLDPMYPYDPLQVKYLNDSKRFAEVIHPNVVSALGLIDRKIHNDQSFYVIRNTQMPSVLVELGYMTNRDEESRIKTADYQQKAAQALANSIIAYFKVFDVYQNETKKATFKTKNEAINYAQTLNGNVRVFDKDTQQNVWENSNFEVYHKSMGLLKSFANEQEAIAYASGYANTRVIEKASGDTIWANFFTQRYIVQDQQGTNSSFFDFNKAVSFAQSKQTARVVRANSNEIIWTSFPNEQITRSLQTSRLDGATRYSTSVSISKMLHPNGFTADMDKTVILTTGVEPADALSAGPLSAIYGQAPILLNNSSSLLPEVKDELKRLGATKVVIIGGPVAISPNVENAIISLGIQTERISGATRFETNLRIVEKLGSVDGVFVASGMSYPDALASAPIAAANNWAIVLTEQNNMSAETLKYLSGKKTVILGGPNVVSQSIQNQLVQQNGTQNVVRLSGSDRYETLASILWYFKDQMKSDTINIATGANFPDALTAAPLSIQNKAPLILLGNGLYKNIESFLYQYTEENLIKRVNVIGGPVAVPQSLETMIVNKAK
ncbi:N-acetylmuramoyl-L-alanine amidase/soluble P-type ATPase [Bacillus niacini]|uniref:N-acetylmuramoyl-L-alanine amidase/soluble P-type ATPase n=1 Tax=Neobacillus niacini TaxID=86668 RepID=A0A852T7V5_9BACI|nr:cell wall-binding repeat-containing protein [Neobacillus niacini]NYE03618.1 N-acetylmuramoyl-L-alanine amidase/soluble P-type ATPase [Neobacillus niacini]